MPFLSSRLSRLSQVSHLFLNHPKIKILTSYCQDMTIWVTCDHFGDPPSPGPTLPNFIMTYHDLVTLSYMSFSSVCLFAMYVVTFCDKRDIC